MKSACISFALLCAVFLLTDNVSAQKANTGRKRDSKTETGKAANMKKFVLLVRFNSKITLAPERLKLLTEKWAALVEKWTKEGNFISSYVLPQEGLTISGADRKTDKGFSLSADGFKVVSVIVLAANNLEEAVELAKAGANLDEGGSIEVREVKVAQTND